MRYSDTDVIQMNSIAHPYTAQNWQLTVDTDKEKTLVHNNSALRIDLKIEGQSVEFTIIGGETVLYHGVHMFNDINDYLYEFIYSGNFTNLIKYR